MNHQGCGVDDESDQAFRERMSQEFKDLGCDMAPGAILCGPRRQCTDGEKHDYSKWEQQGNGGTAVCAKCGHRAIDDAYWM